jgi:hypothetical protein
MRGFFAALRMTTENKQGNGDCKGKGNCNGKQRQRQRQ